MGRFVGPATLGNLLRSNGLEQVPIKFCLLFISIVSFLSTKGLPSSSALSSKFEPTALATNRLAISHSGGEEGKDFSFDAFTIS